MERNSEIRRRAKYPIAGQPILPIKYRDDVENVRTMDNLWKYHRGNVINGSNDKNERRQSNPTIDHRKIYHCSTDVPRTSRNHGLSGLSRTKYVVPQIQDEYHVNDMKNSCTLRLSRNQLLRKYVDNANYAKNIAVVRKNHYIDDFDEANELENSTTFNDNENQADETSEEVVDDERCENTKEFNDKDYEELEANDEIDEESDVSERPIDRMRLQRKIRMDPLPRGQKNSDSIVAPRHHRGLKIGTGKTLERCCHSAADRKTLELRADDEDIEEPEVGEIEPYLSRKLSRRSRQGDETIGISGKKIIQRYTELPERALSTEKRQTRRPRTMRPELEKTTKSSLNNESIFNNKCEHCGRTSGQTTKTASSRNATCRLRDSRYYIGEPIGDEIYEDPAICPTTYQTKPRRTRDSRLPIYESSDKVTTLDDEDDDEIGAIYDACRGKNSREITNFGRSSVRAGDRQDDKSNSKNTKRYW